MSIHAFLHVNLTDSQNAYNPCFILPYSDTLLQEQKSNIHSVLRLTCLQFRKCLSLTYRNFDFCFRFRYNIAEHSENDHTSRYLSPWASWPSGGFIIFRYWDHRIFRWLHPFIFDRMHLFPERHLASDPVVCRYRWFWSRDPALLFSFSWTIQNRGSF